MAVLSGTPLHCVSVRMVRPAMFQDCGSEQRRRRHYLHPALTHTQPQVVASSKPLPFENRNFTEPECCWCGALEALPSKPLGLDAIFYYYYYFDILASSWQILQCLSKRDGRARRAIKQCVDADTDVSAAKHIRQAASGCTKTGHDYTHGCCVAVDLGVYKKEEEERERGR